MNERIPPYARSAEEWALIGFCPRCEIPMMYFEADYEESWAYGKVCPKCGFLYEDHGGDRGRLLEIIIKRKTRRI